MPAKPMPVVGRKPAPLVEDVTPFEESPITTADDEPEDGPSPDEIPPFVEPVTQDEVKEEIEQLVVRLFQWFGILDAELSKQIRQVIEAGAPGRLHQRLYELFRNRIGTVKLEEIIRYGIDGTLKNIARGEGGTDTSMSDLA